MRKAKCQCRCPLSVTTSRLESNTVHSVQNCRSHGQRGRSQGTAEEGPQLDGDHLHNGYWSAAYGYQESQAVGTDKVSVHPARRCAVSCRNQWNTTSDSPRRIQRRPVPTSSWRAHLREAKVYSEPLLVAWNAG